jgi:putative membrane protein
MGLVAAYGLLARGAVSAGDGNGPRAQRREIAFFLGGVLAVWIASDWPIGALGAGYLASVHTVQFLLFTLVAPPLLLAGVPRARLERAAARPVFRRVARVVSAPPLALAIFVAVLVLTHLPPVVDTFKRSQLGSFAFDVSWLAAGVILWWPAVLPIPEIRSLTYPARIGYLALAAVTMVAPSAFLTFARFPLYATYELAPRIGLLSAANDQQVAGLIMRSAGGLIFIAAMSVLFFRWQREEAHPGRPRTGSPAGAR